MDHRTTVNPPSLPPLFRAQSAVLFQQPGEAKMSSSSAGIATLPPADSGETKDSWALRCQGALPLPWLAVRHKYPDVTFGGLPAHRHVLAHHSKVLDDDIGRGVELDSERYPMPSNVRDRLLHWMYGGNVDLANDEVDDLVSLATVATQLQAKVLVEEMARQLHQVVTEERMTAGQRQELWVKLTPGPVREAFVAACWGTTAFEAELLEVPFEHALEIARVARVQQIGPMPQLFDFVLNWLGGKPPHAPVLGDLELQKEMKDGKGVKQGKDTGVTKDTKTLAASEGKWKEGGPGRSLTAEQVLLLLAPIEMSELARMSRWQYDLLCQFLTPAQCTDILVKILILRDDLYGGFRARQDEQESEQSTGCTASPRKDRRRDSHGDHRRHDLIHRKPHRHHDGHHPPSRPRKGGRSRDSPLTQEQQEDSSPGSSPRRRVRRSSSASSRGAGRASAPALP